MVTSLYWKRKKSGSDEFDITDHMQSSGVTTRSQVFMVTIKWEFFICARFNVGNKSIIEKMSFQILKKYNARNKIFEKYPNLYSGIFISNGLETHNLNFFEFPLVPSKLGRKVSFSLF